MHSTILWVKALGKPVATLLGGQYRNKFHVSRSLGIKPLSQLVKDASLLKERGYRLITVKAGFEPKLDIERLAAIRDAVGQNFPLEVDINGGYQAKEAINTLRKMQRYDIESVEQPVPWWDIDGLKFVRRSVDIPIVADESAWTPQDVVRLLKEEAVDAICIKPIKNGGLYLGRRMAEIADAGGIGVVMGSKHPLSPGTSAIRHFAASLPNVNPVLGYGSPDERFDSDIVKSPLVMNQDGSVDLPQQPGLGIEISAADVEAHKIQLLE